MTQKKSQNERLVSYLNQYGRIDAERAVNKFGIKNLRARISELRNNGMTITSEQNPNNRRQVFYKLQTN